MKPHLKEAPTSSQLPAGYDYGRPETARSPVSLEELRQLEDSAGWGPRDAEALQRHAAFFQNNAGRLVDSWRAVIASQPHLAGLFFGPDGQPDEHYKASVKKRFVQWVLDACLRPHDREWLDYQEEIGLRHTPAKKNATDGAHTAPVVPLRHLIAFGAVVAVSTREFFAQAGIQGEELDQLAAAWTKTVQLHIALWSRPYTQAGLW